VRRTVAAMLLVSLSGACGDAPPPAQRCALCPSADDGALSMPIPDDNPLSDAKIELGRFLFYDRRLSGNQSQSCGSCHLQEKAFTDGKVVSLGSTGHPTPRNTPSLANVAYLPVLTWVNPLLRSLEQQAMVPLFADLAVEMGATYHEQEILDRLSAEPGYRRRFEAAFGEDDAPISWGNAIKALASFQRSLVSANAPVDRFRRGEGDALTDAQKRGLALFQSDRLACQRCHLGFNFTTAFRTEQDESWRDSFVNPGLYNLDGRGSYPEDNPGLVEVTDDPRDQGLFRIPSLRNVAVTAPYMHDGSIATLDEVLDHYARGGRGDGHTNPNKHPLLRGFTLTQEDRSDLRAFLHGLTDTEFLTNPAFSDPFVAKAH
jgi:cytochrome c peroxidase